jgi:hypothetical protein
MKSKKDRKGLTQSNIATFTFSVCTAAWLAQLDVVKYLLETWLIIIEVGR